LLRGFWGADYGHAAGVSPVCPFDASLH